MHQKWITRLVSMVTGMMVFVTGCGNQATLQTEYVQTTSQEMKLPVLESELQYEIPVSTVHVLVDRNGYQTNRSKKVFFLGEALSDTFRVVNTANKEVVFSGKITPMQYDEETKEYISQGEFTQVKEAGVYYIETDIIGRSYSFEIADDMNQRLMQGLLQASNEMLCGDSPEELYQLAMSMHVMLLSLQCHGTIFEKDSDLVTWVLKTASFLMTKQDEQGSMKEDYEATAAFYGVMTICVDNFGKYDAALATQYQTAAKNAWNWLKQQQISNTSSALFYAYAANFRINNDTESRENVVSYLEAQKGHLLDDYFSLFGTILYLSTQTGTDRDLCHVVMQELVDQTEYICEKEQENPYLVFTRNIDDNLKEIMLISFIDYVSPSNEYAVVMENSIHYLGGRNPSGNIYLQEDGTWEEYDQTILWQPIWNGILVNCLSGLIDDEE